PLLAGGAACEVSLDGSQRAVVERAEGEGFQVRDAGMEFGDRHRSSPWNGGTRASISRSAARRRSCHELRQEGEFFPGAPEGVSSLLFHFPFDSARLGE